MILCVLAVGDDELAVGDDDNVSSEVARGRAHARVPRELMWMGQQVTQQARSGLLAILGTMETKM
jgi:hypothetical protein